MKNLFQKVVNFYGFPFSQILAFYEIYFKYRSGQNLGCLVIYQDSKLLLVQKYFDI